MNIADSYRKLIHYEVLQSQWIAHRIFRFLHCFIVNLHSNTASGHWEGEWRGMLSECHHHGVSALTCIQRVSILAPSLHVSVLPAAWFGSSFGQSSIWHAVEECDQWIRFRKDILKYAQLMIRIPFASFWARSVDAVGGGKSHVQHSVWELCAKHSWLNFVGKTQLMTLTETK